MKILNRIWAGKHVKITIDSVGNIIAGQLDHLEWCAAPDGSDTPSVKAVLTYSDDGQDDLVNIIKLEDFAISRV